MPRVNSPMRLRSLILRKCLLVFFIIFFSFISISMKRRAQSNEQEDLSEDRKYLDGDTTKTITIRKLERRAVSDIMNEDNTNNAGEALRGLNANQLNDNPGEVDEMKSISGRPVDPVVAGELNDESLNNIDPFSLGNGLSDSDQGLIDFANDDEVESIAAGAVEDQPVTTATSVTSLFNQQDEIEQKDLTTNPQSISPMEDVSEENFLVRNDDDQDNHATVTNQVENANNQQSDKLPDDKLEGDDSLGDDAARDIAEGENLSDLDAVERSAMRQLRSLKQYVSSDETEDDKHSKRHTGRHFARASGDTNVFKSNAQWHGESVKTKHHLTGSLEERQVSLGRRASHPSSYRNENSAQHDSVMHHPTLHGTPDRASLVDKLTSEKVLPIHEGHARGGGGAAGIVREQASDEKMRGHHGHHSSLYSSLPVPFVFSAMQSTIHQGHNKMPHGTSQEGKKRTKSANQYYVPMKSDHLTAIHVNDVGRVASAGKESIDTATSNYYVNHQMNDQLSIDEDNFNRLKRADQPSSKTTRDEQEKERQSKASRDKSKSKSKLTEKTGETGNSTSHHHAKNHTRSDMNATTPIPLINLVPAKKNLECERPAYLEFPPDIFGQKWRARGFVVVHLAVVCYMFYCLAVVCDNYFLPALEECAQRLGLSDDVAGATFMAAGSSAPELFTALLGVFIAKGDVGTGTIVGSAVFNILFVIGLCGVFSTSAKLNWWPVMRDSSYYALTVFALILVICDGSVGTFESAFMLILYVLYIVVMKFNVELRELVVAKLPIEKWGLDPHGSISGAGTQMEDVVESGESIQISKKTAVNSLSSYQSISVDDPYASSWSAPAYDAYADPWNESASSSVALGGSASAKRKNPNYIAPSRDPRKTSLLEAACIQILRHRRLFRPRTHFFAAATLVIVKNRKTATGSKLDSLKKAGPSKGQAKRVMSAIRQDTIVGGRKPSIAPEPEEWLSAPNPLVVGWFPVIQWSLTFPLHAALHYTIPDCKKKPLLFMVTFIMAVVWTALLSYVMVWMVTLIGFTFGIPDSVMGITFLAAGTSIPDAYSSIHVARAGQADMAVSNSIGSNVFDILIGLALPWFIETAVVYPGTTATVKSMGLAYAVILLFVTLIAAVALIHLFKWTLNPKLGYSLLAVYAAFLIVSVALEFNLLGAVNPPTCVIS